MRIVYVLALCLLSTGALATIFVVDSQGNGDFISITDGISGSTSQDTLYIVSYGASYGNVSLSSPRTFIGNGYFGQATGFNASSRLGNVTVNSGSTGSVFIGLEIGTVTFNDSNITFQSCQFTGATTVSSLVSGIVFRQSYFVSTLTIQGGADIRQSIFNYASFGNALSLSGGGSLTLDYNTFYDGNLSIATATASNCIVNSTRVTQVSGTIVDGVSGHKVDTETNLSFETSLGSDRQFTLQGESTALSSSDINAESGAFGFPSGQSQSAYRTGGLPEIPRITQLEYNSITSPGSGLIIRLQAETH